MSDINQCTFTGRLGADPEVKSFQSGDRIANARLAVSQTWKDKQTGERKERTEWVTLNFRGGLVGVVEKFLRKGSQIGVTGQMATRKWQDSNGSDRYSTEVNVRDMTMLGSKSDSQITPKEDVGSDHGFGGGFGSDDLDDDVPF